MKQETGVPTFAFGAEDPEERVFLDAAASATIERLTEVGMLPAGRAFDADGFHDLFEHVRRTFVVAESSITTLMSRILYGIADRLQPQDVLAIGAGSGNALVWLSGPVRGQILGLDIDAEAIRLARRNFCAAGMRHVRLLRLDGHLAHTVAALPHRLVLLDADDPQARKGIYRSLLDRLEADCCPGAVILAHDACFPAFKRDFVPYWEAVRDRSRFRATITLALDSFGLEVTVR